jgi:hypothetical protein
MVSTFLSIAPPLLDQVSGGCQSPNCPAPQRPPGSPAAVQQMQFCCPQINLQGGSPQPATTGESSTGSGGDSVSIVINGVPRASA